MTGAEYGKRTSQHSQPRQQAVLFTAHVRDAWESRPAPTRIVASSKLTPWDIEQYIAAFFVHADRIQIAYEVECDGCALIVPKARTVWCGEKHEVLCGRCLEARDEEIRATMAQGND